MLKNWLIRKDPNARKDWRQKEKGTTEDEMVGWHHRLNRHELEQTLGISEGQGSLACCGPRVSKGRTRLNDWATASVLLFNLFQKTKTNWELYWKDIDGLAESVEDWETGLRKNTETPAILTAGVIAMDFQETFQKTAPLPGLWSLSFKFFLGSIKRINTAI